MKQEPNPITAQIQQLADGRLDFAERTQLLQTIDAQHPSMWRDAALALVERDILAEAAAVSSSNRHRSIAPIWLSAAACLAIICFAIGWGIKPSAEITPQVVQKSYSPALSQPSLYPDASQALLETNEKLAPSGYEASLLTRYVRADLEGGNQLVIPVSQLVLGYGGD